MANSGSRTQYEIALVIGGRVQASLGNSVQKVNNQFDGIAKAAKTAAKVAAAAFAAVKVVDFFADSAKSAIEYESSMAKVAKVVDGLKDSTGALTNEYYEMSDAIIDLSKEIPMTTTEIAEIVEAAGQSNIAKEELLDFAETAAKMGVAFDSTAEQSGEWLAAWRTALGLTQSEVTTLADQINHLGNTSSENAIKLSEVVTTVGSLAKTSGMSGEGVAAMAAAMTKVESNVAATGIKNMLVALTAGESATNRQTSVLKKLGFSATELANKMQIDAQGAILSVLESIQKLPEAEQSAALKNYFGKESLSSIAPLLANLDNLKLQFEKVGDASQYAGSMEAEYASVSATTANDIVIAQNKIEAAKIKIGDYLLPIIGEGAEIAGKIADRIAELGEQYMPVIVDVLDTIKADFIEIQPFLAKVGKTIVDVFKAAYKVMKSCIGWITENFELVKVALIGIGSAIVAYKVVSGIMGVVGAISKMSVVLTNPFVLVVAGLAAAIVGIATAIKAAKENAIKANLAEHFGDIALSLDDLSEVADYIVRTENIDKLGEALNSFKNVDDIQESLNSEVEALNKMNWKVSIGMELTEEEQSEYAETIKNYVDDCQNIVTEKQYAVNIALSVFTDDDLEGTLITNKVNAFYEGKRGELAELGTKLNKAVSDAFTDGLLDMDEVKEITELQAQMAKIQSVVAGSNFDAQLEVMGLQFSGGDLDPESFMALQEKLAEQVSAAKADYDETLQLVIANAKVMLSEGAIDTTEYDAMVDEFWGNYLDQVSAIESRAMEFQLNTIKEQYKDELGPALAELGQKLDEWIPTTVDFEGDVDGTYFYSCIAELTNLGAVDSDTKGAIEKLLESMQPTIAQMEEMRQKYVDAGIKIPESIAIGLQDAYALGALSDSIDSAFKFAGTYMADSEELSKVVETAKSQGVRLHEEFLNAYESATLKNPPKVPGINYTYDSRFTVPPQMDRAAPPPESALWSESRWNQYHLTGHAEGGVFNTPHVAWFAEDGPEAAIPLDGSDNAISLWQSVGQLLGVFDNGLFTPIDRRIYQGLNGNNNKSVIQSETERSAFSYSPTVYIQGNASQDDVENALRVTRDELFDLIDEYQDEKKRSAFG